MPILASVKRASGPRRRRYLVVRRHEFGDFSLFISGRPFGISRTWILLIFIVKSLDYTNQYGKYRLVIRSFKAKETREIWEGRFSKKYPPDIQKKTQMKLGMINNVVDVMELQVPPGNRLHKLSGDRDGQYSISINSQWRICFNFENNHAFNVEITDYH